MLEFGPLPEPALTALAPQDASCPPHACIASSTPYVEERGIDKVKEWALQEPVSTRAPRYKKIILKKAEKQLCLKKKKGKNI